MGKWADEHLCLDSQRITGACKVTIFIYTYIYKYIEILISINCSIKLLEACIMSVLQSTTSGALTRIVPVTG